MLRPDPVLTKGVLIIGPGAVGGVLSQRFARAGIPVSLLGRNDPVPSFPRRRESRSKGNWVPASAGTTDIAFFCVKSQDLPAAIKAAKRFIGPETAVVGIQNGVGHEKVLRAAFGAKRAVLASAYFAADRTAPGVSIHAGGREIDLARSKENAVSADLAARYLRKAGWTVKIEPSEERMLWAKLCFNAATNPLGAVCAAPNGRLAKDPALRELMLRALNEAEAVAKKAGHLPRGLDLEARLLRACRAMPLQRNSMLQDLDGGRPTEIDRIAGPLLAAGRRAGVPTPVLSFLDKMVRELQ